MSMLPRRRDPIGANSSLRPRPATSGRVLPGRPISETPRRVGSSPRIASDRRPPSDRSLPRVVRGGILVAVAAASAFGVVKVRDLVESTDRFALEHVIVTGDADGDDAAATALRESVLAYAELTPGVPFFGVDTVALQRRVEEHPFVREAVITRRGTDTLAIEVRRRAPVAALRLDDALYLVDIDGALMKRQRVGDEADLPLITLTSTLGETTANTDTRTAMGTEDVNARTGPQRLSRLALAMDLIDAAHSVGIADRLSELIEVPAVGFEVILHDGARLFVGADHFERKLRQYRRADAQLQAAGKRFSSMWLDDARRPERVAVRLRAAVETPPRGG